MLTFCIDKRQYGRKLWFPFVLDHQQTSARLKPILHIHRAVLKPSLTHIQLRTGRQFATFSLTLQRKAKQIGAAVSIPR